MTIQESDPRAAAAQAKVLNDLEKEYGAEPVIEQSDELYPIPDSLPWVTVKNLPSLFKPYPAKIKILYRPYTWAEVKLLSNNSVAESQKLNILIRGIRFSTDLTIGELAYMDYQYIALLRKISTEISNVSWQLKYTCQQCGYQNTVTISDKDTDLKELAVDLPVTLEVAGTVLKFDVLRLRDYIPMIEERQTEDRVSLFVYLASIVRGITFEEAYKLFASITNPEDQMRLETLNDSFDYGVNDITHKCEGVIEEPKEKAEKPEEICGFESKLAAHLEVQHLRPFRGDDRDDVD